MGVTMHVHRGPDLPDGLTSPDVYFTPGYGRAATVSDVGEWILLEAFDGAWQLPLIVRTLTDGAKDAVSPYGYAGVYASPSLSSVQVQEAWNATLTCLRELGVISVLLRHSPLVPQAPELPWQQSIVRGHPTIVLEPSDRDAAWSDMEGNCRTKIRKAQKNGYSGEVRHAARQDLAPGGDFHRLYGDTMRRLDAAPLYFFNDDYYTELFDGLGPDLYMTEVRDKAGVVVSIDLLMRHADRLHGHLSGSDRDHARMGSNNLMIWTTIQFAIEQGIHQLHFGGGVSRDDSLYKFKRSFGGRELGYDVSGLVIDDEAYQAHVRSRAKECDTTPDELLASDYFPAYRGGHNEADR